MDFFAALEKLLESKLTSLLTAYLTLFADKMIFLLGAGIPILVIYYGYSIMSGRGSTATLGEMLWNMVRIGIIFEFMKNTGNLLDLSIGFVQELKSGFVGSESIWALLDQVVAKTQKLSEIIKNLDVSTFKIEGAIASVLVWVGAGIVIAYAAIVFIAAEVSIALLIATAPIFIGCLTYGVLKELFNGWLRSIFSCIITLVFATLIVKLGIDIMFQTVEQIAKDPAKLSILTIGALNTIVGVITSALILVSSRMAGNIAGVAATSAIQGGMAAAAYAGTKLGASAAGKGLSYGGKAALAGYRGGKNWMATRSDKAKLHNASQQAALEKTKQENLAS